MSSPITIVLVPSLEELTVEEQIKMCGETFDQRETRHLAIGQMNICCLGCDEVLWNLRYDADKKISKLISGGLKGYVCGDDSNSACAPEDEDASEYGDETEDEDEECDCEGYAWCSQCVTKKGKLPDACQDCGADAVWIKAFDRYSVVDGLCENCHHE